MGLLNQATDQEKKSFEAYYIDAEHFSDEDLAWAIFRLERILARRA